MYGHAWRSKGGICDNDELYAGCHAEKSEDQRGVLESAWKADVKEQQLLAWRVGVRFSIGVRIRRVCWVGGQFNRPVS